MNTVEKGRVYHMVFAVVQRERDLRLLVFLQGGQGMQSFDRRCPAFAAKILQQRFLVGLREGNMLEILVNRRGGVCRSR